MISPNRAQLFVLILLLVCFLCACQEDVRQDTTLNPRKSHRTIKEKTVIVPPEVPLRWKSIKLAVIDKTLGTENIYIVPVGSTFKVPSSKLTFTVQAFLPAFTMEGTTITTSSNELINPGAKVRVSDNGTLVFQGWLFSKFPNTHAVTHPRYGFSMIGVVPVNK